MWCLSSHFDYIIMYSYVPNSIEYLFFWVRVLCNPGWSGTLYDLSLTLNFWSFSLYQVSAGHIGMSFYTQLRQWLKIKPTFCAWEASAILVELHSQCSNNIGYYYSLYVGGLGKFLISNISKYFFFQSQIVQSKKQWGLRMCNHPFTELQPHPFHLVLEESCVVLTVLKFSM